MSFSRVCGQPRAVDTLRAALRSGRLAHAYLLSGAPGTGKRTLARELVRAALCETGGDDACDRCRSCRAVESGNHGDLTLPVIEVGKGAKPSAGDVEYAAAEDSSAARKDKVRLVTDDDRSIPIGSVRALQRELSGRSSTGGRRTALIPGAERMNEEAQNALLKTLEEPAGDRLLVLTASRPEALLPTVISRLARVRLRPLSVAEVAGWLVEQAGRARAEAEELAAASGGSIGAALAADLEAVRAARLFAEERMAGRAGGGALELARAMSDWARERAGSARELEPVRRELLALFAAAAALHRRALLAALGAHGPDVPAGAAAAALAAAGREALCRRCRAILDAVAAVRGYASPELVCRVLAGELAAAHTGSR